MGSENGVQHRRRRRAGVLIGAGTLLLVACSAGGDDSATADESASAEPVEQAATEDGAGGDSAGDVADRDAGDSGGDVDLIDLGRIGRDVIVEMYVTISSDDVQRSVAAVSARAAALGGGVASSEVDFGNPADEPSSRGDAVLVVKVPPDAVDELLSGLEQAGTIQSVNQSAQDVTDQLVDLDVRIANARQSVQNVRRFMEQATDLQELVALESELTRRQTELERLEAQQRNLGDRVALATVTVEIIPTALAPEAPADDDDSIGDAFRRGWDGFLTALWGIAYVIAILLPFLAVAALIALSTLWGIRRHRSPDQLPAARSGTATASDPPPDEELVSAGVGDANRPE